MKIILLYLAMIIISAHFVMASTQSNQVGSDLIATHILNISDSDVDSMISQYPAFVLDCYKTGCSPCEEMSSALSDMTQDFIGKVEFGKIDMSENPGTKAKYKISHYPTLLLFENGILVNRIVGFISKESTKDKIESSFSLYSFMEEIN